jgi:hypothetical protein
VTPAPAPPPPPPVAGAPSALLLVVAGRVVPAKDVFALDEVPVDVLVVVNTVERVDAVEADERADVDATVAVPEVDEAVVALVLPGAKAEVDEAGDETPVVDDTVSSALPAEGAAPAPAPDDEPAVFDATVVELPLAVAWI